MVCGRQDVWFAVGSRQLGQQQRHVLLHGFQPYDAVVLYVTRVTDSVIGPPVDVPLLSRCHLPYEPPESAELFGVRMSEFPGRYAALFLVSPGGDEPVQRVSHRHEFEIVLEPVARFRFRVGVQASYAVPLLQLSPVDEMDGVLAADDVRDAEVGGTGDQEGVERRAGDFAQLAEQHPMPVVHHEMFQFRLAMA